MKKIMMVKYGFVRTPSEDFIDDSSRFTCYKVGRVRVSKHISEGEVYIDARIDGTKLPYEVYSSLPHYKALSRLNGVSLSTLSDDDLRALYEACEAYECEYTHAENHIVMPSLEELEEQCKLVQEKAIRNFTEVEQLISKNLTALAVTLREYEWTTIKRYLIELQNLIRRYDPEKYPKTLYGTSRSIAFCKPDCQELKDSWYYTSLVEMVNRVA
jgi:hypothetical protein